MNNIPESDFDEAVRNTFTKPIVSRIVSVLDQGYETSCNFHDPVKGGNNTTFGTGVYEYTKHEIKEDALLPESPFVIESEYPAFRVAVGPFTLANHKVGDHERQSINSCFPRTDRSARTGYRNPVAEGQLQFDGFISVENVPMNLVLSHLGNPDDGLCAVYVCRPGETRKGKIVSWAYTRCIWRRDDKAELPLTTREDLAPDEAINSPIVRRKPRKDDEFGG